MAAKTSASTYFAITRCRTTVPSPPAISSCIWGVLDERVPRRRVPHRRLRGYPQLGLHAGVPDRTFAAANAVTPGKPFIVIAEDTRRDFSSTDLAAYDGRPVLDAIWNFGYRDEIRLLATDDVTTQFGQAPGSGLPWAGLRRVAPDC